MRHLRLLLSHPLAGPGLRYCVSGGAVAVVYLGVPVVLNGGAGVPIEVTIPIAYLLAISLHFTLQRYFVFRHVPVFSLSGRGQIGRYAMIAAIQYPTTAVATALLPGVLGLSSRATFLIVAVTMSVTIFLVLRAHIFHPDADLLEPPAPDSRAEDEVVEQDLLGQGRSAQQRQPDSVQAGVQ